MDCQSGRMTVEQAQYVNQQNQQQHRIYDWRNNQNSMPPFQVSKPPLKKKIDLEEALAHMMTSHTTFMNEMKATFQNQAQQVQNKSTQLQNQGAQLRNLEVQIGQMAPLLTERQSRALPSNSEMNLRQEGNEHVIAVTLRSGKELVVPGQPPVIGEVETEEVIQTS